MKRNELQHAVEEKAQLAADLGAQAYSAAKAKIGPYVEQAGEKIGPYVEQASEKVVPLAQDAVTKSAQATAQALESVLPHVDETLAKIAPAIEGAREKMATDIVPSLTDALHGVAKGKVGAEVESVAEQEPAKKKKTGKRFLIFSIVAAGLAGAVVLVKKLTESRSGWEQHTPSSYTPPTFTTQQADEDMTAEGAPLADDAAAEENTADLSIDESTPDESTDLAESASPGTQDDAVGEGGPFRADSE